VLQRTQAATRAPEQYVLQAEADFGELIPARTTAFGLNPYLIGIAGLNYTSNPSLSNNRGRGDLYFVGGGGAGIYPKLVGGLYLDGHVSDLVYQYAHFSSLNFNYFNAGGGLDYVFENLGDLTASIRFEYERYLDGGSLREFFVNNSLTFSLYKDFPLTRNFAFRRAGRRQFRSLPSQPKRAFMNLTFGSDRAGAFSDSSSCKPSTFFRSSTIHKVIPEPTSPTRLEEHWAWT
jgi:hypothetical protein